jgi:predicted  nucleic acid-binding Zn-ribbon protein
MTQPQGPATCPKCGSPSIQAVPIEKKKVGDAVIAEYFLGTAAGVAAGTSTVIQAMCLSCGCQWFPGTKQEQQMRALSGKLGDQAKRVAESELAEQEKQLEIQARDKRIVVLAIILIILALIVYWGVNQ